MCLPERDAYTVRMSRFSGACSTNRSKKKEERHKSVKKATKEAKNKHTKQIKTTNSDNKNTYQAKGN